MLAKYIVILYIYFFQVLHLDGIFVNKKHSLYSNSNILYDLIVSTNTKFNLMKPAQQYENDDIDNHYCCYNGHRKLFETCWTNS